MSDPNLVELALWRAAADFGIKMTREQMDQTVAAFIEMEERAGGRRYSIVKELGDSGAVRGASPDAS